jgi:hypothetical protein
MYVFLGGAICLSLSLFMKPQGVRNVRILGR